jgi:hypothetical protein
MALIPTFMQSTSDFYMQGRKVVRSITRACVKCRHAAKPQEQLMGQLPVERVTPDLIFNRIGVDYAGPLQLKLGSTWKPVIVKSYACIFVWLSVCAVHLDLISDMTTDAREENPCSFGAIMGQTLSVKPTS